MKLKYFELDKEEQELLDSVERGEWQSVPNLKKEMARLRASARFTLARNKNINIRLSELDLIKLKGKAAEQGLPYQTLIASIIHRYNNGTI